MEFSLVCDIYLKDNAPRVRETTLEQKRYYIEQILKPYFQGMLVGDIDAKTVIDWENHLLESRTKRGTPYTATYLNTLCSQLSAIMNHLVRFYGLERNPVQIAGKVGSKEKREMNLWTREQYLRFSDAVADKPYSHIAFGILFWCGLRVGEMLALTPSDIDFETSQIHITKSFGRTGGMDVINPPKTPQSNRVVTMPSFLAEEIEEYLRLHAKAKPDARIFPTITKHLLHHEMTRGSKAAGLKRIRIHDLRHSHATMLVEMGMSVPSIAARLGHSGETVTHRYLHLLPGSEAAIASKLDALVSLSGLAKQDYIECCLTNQSVTVYPSSRIARFLLCWMQSIYRELVIAREEGRMLDADLLWIARAVSEEYGAMASAEPIKDANEAMRGIERDC